MGRRIVIGDIHGCYNTLKNLIESQIIITSDDQVFFVGDLIDRGPRSREVLDYLMQLKLQQYHINCVRGNHEEMLLKTLDADSSLQDWFMNGAEETLKSFAIQNVLLNRRENLKLIPEPYITFMQTFPYYYDLEDHIIVHAGLNFNSKDILEDTHSMIWSRTMEYEAGIIKNKTIIHGHTPITIDRIMKIVPYQSNKTLNIDSGCVYKNYPGLGVLTAIDLDNRHLYLQNNID